nr:hypothetical protein Iba_chr13fCG9470 [Ipomoea batatas]
MPEPAIAPAIQEAIDEGRKTSSEKTIVSPFKRETSINGDVAINYSPLSINGDASIDYSPLSINGDVSVDYSPLSIQNEEKNERELKNQEDDRSAVVDPATVTGGGRWSRVGDGGVNSQRWWLQAAILGLQRRWRASTVLRSGRPESAFSHRRKPATRVLPAAWQMNVQMKEVSPPAECGGGSLDDADDEVRSGNGRLRP